jgi:hypothetical protein
MRHSEVGDHDREGLTSRACGLEFIHPGLASVGRCDQVPIGFQRIAQRLEEQGIIIDDEDA